MSVASAPSDDPSQSSSTPLQTSVAPGFTAAVVSSQSVSTSTYPEGASQVSVAVEPAAPYPSPSLSRYQVPTSEAEEPSTVPSQSLSTSSQTSLAFGWIESSLSLQSVSV